MRQGGVRKGERENLPSVSSSTKRLQQPGLDRFRTRSLRIQLGCPCGWCGPKQKGHQLLTSGISCYTIIGTSCYIIIAVKIASRWIFRGPTHSLTKCSMDRSRKEDNQQTWDESKRSIYPDFFAQVIIPSSSLFQPSR